jgi:hypothetical protein
MATDSMTVKINPNDKGNPVGKLADAELHFSSGPLEGLKLIGFGIWERRGASGRNVTFPARQYSMNGERTPKRRNAPRATRSGRRSAHRGRSGLSLKPCDGLSPLLQAHLKLSHKRLRSTVVAGCGRLGLTSPMATF